MEIVTLGLVAVSVVLNVIVLSHLAKISRQVEQPIVKKMSPELNLKSVRKDFDDKRPKSGHSKSNRSNRNVRSKKKDDDSSDKRTGRPRNQRNRLQPSSEIYGNDKPSHDGDKSHQTGASHSHSKSEPLEIGRPESKTREPNSVKPNLRSESKEKAIQSDKSSSQSRPRLSPRGQKNEPKKESSPRSTPGFDF